MSDMYSLGRWSFVKGPLSRWEALVVCFVFVVLFILLFARLEAQATQLEILEAEIHAVRTGQMGLLERAMLKTGLSRLEQRVEWLEMKAGWR